MQANSISRRSILNEVMAWARRCLTLLHLKSAWEKGKAPEDELAAKVGDPPEDKELEEEIFQPKTSSATAAFDPSKAEIKVYGSLSSKARKGLAFPIPENPAGPGVQLLGQLGGNKVSDGPSLSDSSTTEPLMLPPVKPANPCILVIDDYPPLLNMLTMALKTAGFDVCTAKDGLEGLVRLHENHVDLVVSDVQMPKIDGFDLRRMLNVRDSTRELPMIYLTEVLDQQTKAIAKRLGVGSVLLKPFTLDCLLESVKLGLASVGGEVAEAESQEAVVSGFSGSGS